MAAIPILKHDLTPSGSKRISKKDLKLHKMLDLFLILTLLTSCSSKEAEKSQEAPARDMTPKKVMGLGRVEPELKILDLTSETSGIVKKIYFNPGDFVAQGQTIVELSDAIEKAKVEQAAAKIRTQHSQIDAAKAAMAATKIKTENAKLSYERARTLYEGDAQTKSNFDHVKSEYESQLEEVKRMEANVIAAQNLLKQYEADQRLAQTELSYKFIAAPAGGQLLSLDITLGSLVSPEKPFGAFAPQSALTAWCEIDELFAPSVQPGQKAFVRYQGMTDVLAWGKVTFVGPYLKKKSIFSDEIGDLEDRRVREVRITLEPDSKILIGSRVECVILLSE